MSKKNKKICFAASTGGHFEQLLMLKPLMEKYDGFILTEKTSYKTSVKGQKMYYHQQINRKEALVVPKLVWNFIKSFWIFIKERPDVIITTGVLAMIPMSWVAKKCGKKLIYIESFAKVSDPTKTGQFLYKYADQFYVQWETMLKFYPDAIYLGGIY